MKNISPISNGTRMRSDHNTFANVITSFNSGVNLSGEEIWTAPADGSEVKEGDQWLLVTHVDGTILTTPGWTAIIHKGQTISNRLADTDPDPDPTPDPGSIVEIIDSVITYKAFDGSIRTQRMIPE